MSNFWERQRTFQTVLWIQLISRTRFASEVGYTGKRSTRYDLFPSPCYILFLQHFRWVSRERIFFCQDDTDNCTLARSADSLVVIWRDHSTPPQLGNRHGMGSPRLLEVLTHSLCLSWPLHTTAARWRAWHGIRSSVRRMLTIWGSGSRCKHH